MKTVIVVGGGLAGIAAAEAAARRGWCVMLVEWRRVLGGRVASILDSRADGSGDWLDNGQHILLGCCTESLALCKRLGLDNCFERCDAILFASTMRRRWRFAPTPFLPRQLQFLPALIRTPFLSWRDRLAVIQAVRKLNRLDTRKLGDTTWSVWADQQRISAASRDNFWTPLILSALSELPENASLAAVQRIVRDGFLTRRDGMRMFIPNRPLRAILGDAAKESLERLGVQVILGERVVHIAPDKNTGVTVTTASDNVFTADAAVLALPTTPLWRLAEDSTLGDDFLAPLHLDRFEPGAITTLHLWFDRRITPVDCNAVALLGGVGQMLLVPNTVATKSGVLHTVVISASHHILSDAELVASGHTALVTRIAEQLRDTFPEVFAGESQPQLLHSRVTTVFDAVFAPKPSLYTSRPHSQTVFPRVTIAGDWTQTGLPATIEGAVRSGHSAIDCLDADGFGVAPLAEG